MEEQNDLALLIKQEEEKERCSIYEWAEALIIALVVATLISACCFRLVGVSGNSMVDTLHNKDFLLLFNSFYGEPEYGDIIVIRRDDGEPLIKRVIAKEGDTVAIDPDEQVVYLNGEKLDEPYLNGPTPVLYGFTGPYTVPEDSVFVLGDNRADSHDSRDLDRIGAVHEDDIMGKAVFRILPLQSFGSIYE